MVIENCGNGWKITFLTPFNPPGDATRIFLKNPRMSHFFALVVITSCKISEKSNEWLLRIFGTNVKTPIFDPSPPWGHNENFPQKSENARFPPMGSCNFKQNFRKI